MYLWRVVSLARTSTTKKDVIIGLDGVLKLQKDLKEVLGSMSKSEASYLVKSYYQIQDYRKSATLQGYQLEKSNRPNEVITWLADQMKTLEGQIKRALDKWTDNDPVGAWSKSIVGIGPVISAGLLAYIDIEKAPTAGHIWSFAGLNPEAKWGKGQLRPWSNDLKVLCWKIGESFVKVSNHEDDVYGKLYLARKQYEIEKNEQGAYAEQAAEILRARNIGKDTEAYKYYSEGKLPPAHIHARAKRYAVKIFLSHWHHVAYVNHFGEEPPKPFAIAQLGHAHMIPVPNFNV